jgi:phage terminase small subunit
MPRKKKADPASAEAARGAGGRGKGKQENALPDGEVLDLDSIDWGDAKLTAMRKRFIFWYTYPGSSSYMRSSESAVKAGYSKGQSRQMGYKLRHDPEVAKVIRRVVENTVKADLEEEYHRILELKRRRVHYDIKDYFKKVTVTDPDTKQQYQKEVLKDLDELSDEQRQAIDSVDYRSQRGLKVYIMANREKSMDDLVSMFQKTFGDKGDDGFDVETTAEIIKDKLSVKTTVRKKKDLTAEAAADFLEASRSLPEEE